MTNHTGTLLEVREALERSLDIGYSSYDKDKALTKLDAILAAVPEGLGDALSGEDVHRHIEKQTIAKAAALLSAAVTKGE